MSHDTLLDIEHLTVRFGANTAVDDVSFSIARGEKFALVGESGSGKSVTALSVLRLLEAAATTGAIRFGGEDLRTKSEREMRGIRGARIAMIFQEPMTALNSLYTVGNQIAEVLELHEAMRPEAARARAVELLGKTGIPEPERRVGGIALGAFAHEPLGRVERGAGKQLLRGGRHVVAVGVGQVQLDGPCVSAGLLRLGRPRPGRFREVEGPLWVSRPGMAGGRREPGGSCGLGRTPCRQSEVVFSRRIRGRPAKSGRQGVGSSPPPTGSLRSAVPVAADCRCLCQIGFPWR